MINDGVPQETQPGSFAILNREWGSGDRIRLELPLAARTQSWDENSVVVERGPLLFSLPIETGWEKLRARGLTADWEARPKSAWNYALAVDQPNPRLAETSRAAKAGKSIFELEGAPIGVEVRGKKIPQWKAANGVAGDLPSCSVSSIQPFEKLSLVPYSAAKLRTTVFPVLERSNIAVDDFSFQTR